MVSRHKSIVWTYFTRVSKDEAQCLKCHKILKSAGGSTSGLKTHAHKVHQIHMENDVYVSNRPGSQLPIQKGLYAENLTQMILMDGFSYSQIVKSEALRRFLKPFGKLPSNSQSVKGIFLQFTSFKKSELSAFFSLASRAGRRYSLSVIQNKWKLSQDLYTLSLHDETGASWSLGCLLQADDESLKRRVEEFKLNWKRDIVGVLRSFTTKVGREAEEGNGRQNETPFLIPCLSHQLHSLLSQSFFESSNQNEEYIDDYEEPFSFDDSHSPFISAYKTHEYLCSKKNWNSNIRSLLKKLTPSLMDGVEDYRISWKGLRRALWPLLNKEEQNYNGLYNEEEKSQLKALCQILYPFEIVIQGLSSSYPPSLIKGYYSLDFLATELESLIPLSPLAQILVLQVKDLQKTYQIVSELILLLESSPSVALERLSEPLISLASQTYSRLFDINYIEKEDRNNDKGDKEEDEERKKRKRRNGKGAEDDEKDVNQMKEPEKESKNEEKDPMMLRYLRAVERNEFTKNDVTSSFSSFVSISSFKSSFHIQRELEATVRNGVSSEALQRLKGSLSSLRASTSNGERAFYLSYTPELNETLSFESLDAYIFLKSFYSSGYCK